MQAREASNKYGSRGGMASKTGTSMGKSFDSKVGMSSQYGKGGMFSGKNVRQEQRKQMAGQVDQIVDLFKQDASFMNVENKMGRNALGSINVGKEFQTAQFKFNPMGQLTTKGWELKIPDYFKKVDDTRYVAPEETYTSKYEKLITSKGKKRIEKQEGKYIPTEIILDPKGKLDKVIKRGVFQDYEDKGGGERIYTQKVYDKEVQDYEGDYLQSKNVFDIFTTEQKRRSSGDEKEKRATYLKEETKYGPYGRAMQSFQYDSYGKGERVTSAAPFQSEQDVVKRAEELSKSMYGTGFGNIDNASKRQQVLRSLQSEVQQQYTQPQSTTRREKFETGLRKVQYYDEWGRPVDTIKL